MTSESLYKEYDKFFPEGNIKQCLEFFRNEISNSLSMLKKEMIRAKVKLETKQKVLFIKCVDSQEQKNVSKAVIYAVECAQVRKNVQILILSQLLLEKTFFIIETKQNLMSIATKIKPFLEQMKESLIEVVPEISLQIEKINQNLDIFITEYKEGGELGSSSLLIDEFDTLSDLRVLNNRRSGQNNTLVFN